MQTQSNTLDFTGQNIYVGCDVHLKSWKITIMSDLVTHKTFSQDPKPALLMNYLKKNFPGATYHSAYEAGFCGYWIHNELISQGVKSIVVNPADIPTTHKEKVQKEDKRDSRKIAQALRGGNLKAIHVPSQKTIEDRCLMRTRQALVQDVSRSKNRIKSHLRFLGIEIPDKFSNSSAWTKAYVNWLKSINLGPSAKQALQAKINACKNVRADVLETTKGIKKLSEAEAYKANIQLLRTVPGVGLLTAMLLLTELEDISRFENVDKLCSFIGLIPSTHSTGDNQVIGKVTPRSHSLLRGALIESAWVACRIDPALLKSYQDFCKRMNPNKAVIKIAKKLISRISYVLKEKKEYVKGVVK